MTVLIYIDQVKFKMVKKIKINLSLHFYNVRIQTQLCKPLYFVEAFNKQRKLNLCFRHLY